MDHNTHRTCDDGKDAILSPYFRGFETCRPPPLVPSDTWDQRRCQLPMSQWSWPLISIRIYSSLGLTPWRLLASRSQSSAIAVLESPLVVTCHESKRLNCRLTLWISAKHFFLNDRIPTRDLSIDWDTCGRHCLSVDYNCLLSQPPQGKHYKSIRFPPRNTLLLLLAVWYTTLDAWISWISEILMSNCN